MDSNLPQFAPLLFSAAWAKIPADKPLAGFPAKRGPPAGLRACGAAQIRGRSGLKWPFISRPKAILRAWNLPPECELMRCAPDAEVPRCDTRIGERLTRTRKELQSCSLQPGWCW